MVASYEIQFRPLYPLQTSRKQKTLEKPNKIRDRATAFLRMRHEFAEKAEEK
jgi:hypothetical protein